MKTDNERPLMETPPVNYQHHTDEWKCRQFAAMFPSKAMDKALRAVEQEYDSWTALASLIRSGGIHAGYSLVAQKHFDETYVDTEPECNTPEHSGHFSNWSPEPHELR